MEINLSISSSVNLEEELCIQESFIEKVFNEIVDLILKNDAVKEMSNNKYIFNKTIEEIEMDLYFCKNQEIQNLNRHYRNIDEPTDVLTFAMQEDTPIIIDIPILNLGEIIISTDKVIQQAKENNHSTLVEIIILITHGVLHLLECHHDTDEKYNKILNFQNQVLKDISALKDLLSY